VRCDLRDERLQLAVATAGNVGIDAALECCQAQLLDPRDLFLCEGS
jgi:hypothetical protein